MSEFGEMGRYARNLAERGEWAVVRSSASEVSRFHETVEFTFSLGASLSGRMEAVICGLPGTVSSDIINEVAGRITAGRPVDDGDVLIDVANTPIRVYERGHHIMARGWLGPIREMFPEIERIVVLVYPDASGAFPGDAGCDPEIEALQAWVVGGDFTFGRPAMVN